MAGNKSSYTEGNLLKVVFQGTPAFPVPAGTWVALFNGLTTATHRTLNDGTNTATEVSGNAYARAAYTNSSTNWPVTTYTTPLLPGKVQNAVTISFATPTGTGWGTIYSWGLYDALTTGNLLYWGDLCAAPQSGYVSFASPGVISIPAHGYTESQQVRVSAPSMGSLPAAYSDEVIYFVHNLTADTFSLSTTTANGAPVNTAASGSVQVALDLSQAIGAGATVQFAINGLVITDL